MTSNRNSSNEELVRCHIWLRADDVRDLKLMYGTTAGFSKAIRTILHQYVVQIKARAEEKAKSVRPVDLPAELPGVD